MNWVEMSAGEIVLIIIADLCITVFFYLLVPLILVVKGNKYTDKQLKKIITINCVVVWLIFAIFRVANDIEGTSGAVFLWGWVGYRMLKRRCLITEEKKSDRIKKDVAEKNADGKKKYSKRQDGRDTYRVCISDVNSKPFAPYGINEFYGDGFTVRRNDESAVRIGGDNSINQSMTMQKRTATRDEQMKRCLQCDSEIPSISKFCQYCGRKQVIQEKQIQYCRECGNKLKDEYVFCNICGTKVITK